LNEKYKGDAMISLVADTICGLPVEQLKALNIAVVPQMIVFGDQTYRDDNEIDTATFLKKLRASSTLPKTAAPPPALYIPIYEECIARGDTVIVIAPSADVSGTVRSATVAAQDFPGADIRVIDTRTVAGGLGSIVLAAHRWIQTGSDADTVVSQVKEMATREKLYFVVDTLEYLYKGGRIGGAQALLGSLLQIKPILTLKDGRVQSFESERTKRRALARVQDLVFKECPYSPESYLTVSHCEAYDEAKEFADFFKQTLNLVDVPIYLVPPAIVVHAGPKVIEVSFFISQPG
jgi:DegV family protein with EDD domain